MPRFIANLKRQQDECSEYLECECVRMNVRNNMSVGTSLITFSVIELKIVREIEVSRAQWIKSGNAILYGIYFTPQTIQVDCYLASLPRENVIDFVIGSA